MKVYLIGVGMGNQDTLTLGAVHAIEESCALLGAPRLLEPWIGKKECLPMVRPTEIAAAIDRVECGPVAVLLSGDAGFYSGAKGLRPLLEHHETLTIPGISSLSYFCARLGMAWQDIYVVSAHGRTHNAVGEIQCHGRTFILTGGNTTAQDICRELANRGMGYLHVWVGEALSYPEERIISGAAEELLAEEFADLAVLLAENPTPIKRPFTTPGLPDSVFQRGNVPMTKEEVRALVLTKLHPARHHIFWDVGAGTGSVSVECALAAPAGRVFAVEYKEEALELTVSNATAMGVSNLSVVSGAAPEVLHTLPAPDRVFVGGSNGHLAEIIRLAMEKNPAVRLVISAVTLETLHEAVSCCEKMRLTGVDVVQVSVTRTREVGRYHMMDAQNPVWLISAEGAET